MHNLKLQSSMEFLSTYGWAIIIIVIVLAFVVYLLATQTSSIPSICTFSSGFSCSDFLLESNSLSSTYFFFLTNNQQYPIKGTTVTATVGTLGEVTAPCSPSLVLPGGDLICSGTTTSTVNSGETLTGVANVNTSECTSISNPIACTQKYNVNYSGKLTTVTTNYAPNACSITIKYPTIFTGEKYPISAEVLLNGNPLTGATVNFTTKSSLVTLAPQYTNSGSNGTAITYFEAQSSGSYTIKASFYTCSEQINVPVTNPLPTSRNNYVPITLTNQQSTGTPTNFQQMIYFSPSTSTYSSYVNANLSNIEFTADEPAGISGSVPLYSWIESGASATASNTVIWVNLGSVTLGPAQSYISVNVINSQNTATGTDFQQMIYFDPSTQSYLPYEAADLGNIRFYYGNTELYSWCESGCTSTSSNAVFWINTGSLNIGPNSYATVNMIFEPTSTEYDGVYAGEAPQLSSSYGEYDNGANVFNFYDNFAGTSLNSNKWNPISYSTDASYTINNGITFTVTAASNDIALYSINKYNPANYIEEQGIRSLNIPVTNAEYTADWFISPPTSTGAFSTDYRFELLSTGSALNYRMCGDPNGCGVLSGSVSDTVSSIIFGAYWLATGTEYIYQNYTQEYSYGNSGNPITPSYIGTQFNIYTTAGTISGTLNYIRLRVYPPSGVMPTFQLSGINTETSGQNTATIYLNFLPNNSPATSGYIGYAPQDYCSSGCFQTTFGQYNNIQNVMQSGLSYQIYYDPSGTCSPSGYENQLYGALLGNQITVNSCATFTSATPPFTTPGSGTSQDVDGTTQQNVILNYQNGYSGGVEYPNPPITNLANSWQIKAIGWVVIPSSTTFYGISDDGEGMGYSFTSPTSSSSDWLGGTSNPSNIFSYWNPEGATTYSGTISTPGVYRIEYDYFEDGGGSYTGLYSSNLVNYYSNIYPPSGVMPSFSFGTLTS